MASIPTVPRSTTGFLRALPTIRASRSQFIGVCCQTFLRTVMPDKIQQSSAPASGPSVSGIYGNLRDRGLSESCKSVWGSVVRAGMSCTSLTGRAALDMVQYLRRVSCVHEAAGAFDVARQRQMRPKPWRTLAAIGGRGHRFCASRRRGVARSDCNHRHGRLRPIGAGYRLKLASTAAPFCIRFAPMAASSAQPKVPLTRDGHDRGGTP